MSEYWFYQPTLVAAGERLTLTAEEAHHATSVRRLHDNDPITLFDGRGHIAHGHIENVADRKGDVGVRIASRATQAASLPVHLACALAKGDRQATLLDMATQLGMTAFTPLSCERSVVKTTDNATARWQRICLEACKQSRRAHLPRLDAATTPAAFVHAAVARGEQVIIADPRGVPFDAVNAAPRYSIMVGPEGGFTEHEVTQAGAAGAQAIRLGGAILRIETAAIAMLAALALMRAE